MARAVLAGLFAAAAASCASPPPSPEPEAAELAPAIAPGRSGAPAASAEGITLYGVSGPAGRAAAILGSRLGGQRVVPVGRDYRPGLRLAEVGVDHAVLDNGVRPVRLELSRYASGGSAKAAAALPADEEQKIEAAVLRNILKPVMSNDRIGGYALRSGESLPQLVRAGLRPGDVLVSVNGSQLDEERMSELAWQMGNAAKTEFVFIRNGKKMRAAI